MKRCCTPGVFPSPSPSIPANGWSRAPMFWRCRFTTRTPILRTSLPAHFWHWLGLRRHRFPLVSFPIGGSLLPPEYHTNFKLKPGEPVILSNASGSLLDLASLPTELRAGVTMGRAEGASDWCFFTSPSPGSANLSSCLSHVAPAPVVEPASGWYAASTVTASPGQPSGPPGQTLPPVTLRFTVDGSEPTPSSSVFTGFWNPVETSVLSIKAFGEGMVPSETGGPHLLPR